MFLLKEVQKHEKQNKEYRNELDELKNENELLKSTLDNVLERLEELENNNSKMMKIQQNQDWQILEENYERWKNEA